MAKKRGIKRTPKNLLEILLKKNNITPRIDEMVQGFFECAGGARNVAKLMFDEYVIAKPGSIARQRILATVMSAVKASNMLNKGTLLDDLGLLNEDDIAEILKSHMAEAHSDGEEEAAGTIDGATGVGTDPGPGARDAGGLEG